LMNRSDQCRALLLIDFQDPALEKLLREHRIKEIVAAGLNARACVAATTKAAARADTPALIGMAEGRLHVGSGAGGGGGTSDAIGPNSTIAAAQVHDHEGLYVSSRLKPFITPKAFIKIF
jgi:hypothetical protein